MKIVPVPSVPRRAFDPARKASDLLRRQVEHFDAVVRQLKGFPLPAPSVDTITEAEAASYVAEAMRLLKMAPPRRPAATTPARSTDSANADRAASSAGTAEAGAGINAGGADDDAAVGRPAASPRRRKPARRATGRVASPLRAAEAGVPRKKRVTKESAKTAT